MASPPRFDDSSSPRRIFGLAEPCLLTRYGLMERGRPLLTPQWTIASASVIACNQRPVTSESSVYALCDLSVGSCNPLKLPPPSHQVHQLGAPGAPGVARCPQRVVRDSVASSRRSGSPLVMSAVRRCASRGPGPGNRRPLGDAAHNGRANPRAWSAGCRPCVTVTASRRLATVRRRSDETRPGPREWLLR